MKKRTLWLVAMSVLLIGGVGFLISGNNRNEILLRESSGDSLSALASLNSCSSTGNSSEYKFIKKWGTPGSGDSQFKIPRGIAVDSLGNVYVADTKNHRIQKFTGEGVFIKKWGTVGTGNGQLNSPVGLAIDSQNNVYVSDAGNNRIQKFTSDGAFIQKWTAVSGTPNTFNTPEGIAITPTGGIMVADTGNNRVVGKYHNSDTWGVYGNFNQVGGYSFNLPIDVAAHTSGIFISEAGEHLIKKYNSSSAFVTQWEVTGPSNGDPYFSPRGITSDIDGNIFVANTQADEIHKYTENGGFITKFGATGQNNGQFKNMYDIAVDHLGNVYVVDTGNSRVQKFAPVKCGKIIVKKEVQPRDDPEDFTFGRSFGLNFLLDDDASDTTLSDTASFFVNNSLPGTSYKVYELKGRFMGMDLGYGGEDFELISINCADPTGDTTTQIPGGILRAGTANIVISDSETVTCTFVNSVR
jgi:streptogramin lyase